MKPLPKRIRALQNKLDKEIQVVNREKNLVCECCGKPADVLHHHIQKRQSLGLRYDEDNLIPLCSGCHLKHHKGDPHITACIVAGRGIEWHERLQEKRNKFIKRDLKYEQYLKDKLEELTKHL